MNMKDDKKGQAAAIVGVILGLVLLAVTAITLPIWFEFVEVGVNASEGKTNGDLIQVTLNAIPVFLILIVLVAIVVFVTGR